MMQRHHRVLLYTFIAALALLGRPTRAADEVPPKPHPGIRAVEATKDGRGLVAIREDGSRFEVCHFPYRNLTIDRISSDRRWATVYWNTEDESQGSLAGSVPMHTALVSVDLRRFLLTEDLGLAPHGDFYGFSQEGSEEVLSLSVGGKDATIPLRKLESMVKPKAKRSR